MTEKLKLCFISDTHNSLGDIINFIPECDYLIHCGDMTGRGTIPELSTVNKEFGKIKSVGMVKEEIIFIAGNHDILFETNRMLAHSLFNNARYLEDSGTYLKNGMYIYGSPVNLKFFNWAFNREKGEDIDRYWRMIPDETDILITHTPAYGIRDLNYKSEHCGCQNLRDHIKRLSNLKIHAFGHIHFSYGTEIINNVKVVNASTMGEDYKKLNPPILVEV